MHYDEAVIPFYKALKVYPDPNELLMIYQKTIPQPVFEIVVKALAIEVSSSYARVYAGRRANG